MSSSLNIIYMLILDRIFDMIFTYALLNAGRNSIMVAEACPDIGALIDPLAQLVKTTLGVTLW